jgi:predicted CXXCH cytochrome family protein
VAFVGSEVCRTCHLNAHASYLRTGMGRSMAEVDLGREPPDAEFDHELSKRRYQVRRKDGRLWHRELLLTKEPDEIVLSEFPLKYVVGSGRHSLTYLVEADGFLVESPVTWYTSKKAWGMSPGYDRPNHSSFERATGESCLICHAGQATAQHGSLHIMHIGEAAIGCERCHGPGALHVARHHAPRPAQSDPAPVDHTIVNPAHLSRELGEAVCQQCHLRTSATIVARGRKPGDFRPGLPLQDFRHDYRLDVGDTAMTVVGHVEQMHLSRCYQASGTLTCITCHDPHHEPRPKARDGYYKSLCLSCHQSDACKVEPRRLREESPQNHCVQCHMPRSPTEIPHLAFTHHRIGIHAKPMAPGDPDHEHGGFGVLKPFLDLSRVQGVDEKRSLGLGYLEAANRHKDEHVAMRYRELSLSLLTEARAAGLRDGPLDASLARLRFDMELDDGVLELAESALALGGLDGQDNCNALFLIADQLARQGRRGEAIPYLEKLGRLRRHSTQWLLRADCERAVGSPAALHALLTAVRINPRLWQVHRSLADHYQRAGDGERATWHERRATP